MNMSQEELAQRLEVNWVTISRWENGGRLSKLVESYFRNLYKENGIIIPWILRPSVEAVLAQKVKRDKKG
jgi:transcriptional regulator with XRE-family HTH domain